MSRLNLIAHRGEPETWPENSLAGFSGALAAGARFLETDVQLTRDGIAVLCHDPSLARMTGHDLLLSATDYATLRDLPAGEPGRFGTRFADLRIARLEEFVELLQQWPQASAFVEIKPDGIAANGTAMVVDSVLQTLRPALAQCTLISFEVEPLAYARARHGLPIGWVIPEWNAANQARATALAPDFLFCNRKRLPPPGEPLWPGDWRWVAYTINAVEEIPQFTRRGICMLETNGISQLLADPRLDAAGCD